MNLQGCSVGRYTPWNSSQIVTLNCKLLGNIADLKTQASGWTV